MTVLRIPFTRRDRLIYVSATLKDNHHGQYCQARLLFDTGASSSIIHRPFLRDSLGFKPPELPACAPDEDQGQAPPPDCIRVTTGSKLEWAAKITVPSILLFGEGTRSDSYEIHNAEVLTYDLPEQLRVQGILGLDHILRHFRVFLSSNPDSDGDKGVLFLASRARSFVIPRELLRARGKRTSSRKSKK